MTLLHVCCGPCAVYPAMVLKEENIKFEAYFFNPNIHPEDEFIRRRDNALIWAEKAGIKLHINDNWYTGPWLRSGMSKKDRCAMCYRARIAGICAYARKNRFDTVTSTLLVSPYQDHTLITEIFNEVSAAHNLSFLYIDFRPGFRTGQNIAKEYDLYRQKYCGCLPSMAEAGRKPGLE